MNNLYGQTQVLGKATATTQSLDNGMFNYVLPYNQNDFFAYSDISFVDINTCPAFDLNSQYQDIQCDISYNTFNMPLKDASGNSITLNAPYCLVREMCKNKAYADQIMQMDRTHAATDGQYLDVITSTNMQSLNVTNLSIGIVIMLILAFSYA